MKSLPPDFTDLFISPFPVPRSRRPLYDPHMQNHMFLAASSTHGGFLVPVLGLPQPHRRFACPCPFSDARILINHMPTFSFGILRYCTSYLAQPHSSSPSACLNSPTRIQYSTYGSLYLGKLRKRRRHSCLLRRHSSRSFGI
jgi:hypothetical protein